MKNFNFCWDQEGHKGREVESMHALHFVAFAFVDISEVRIFYFGINIIVAFAKILNLLFLCHFGIVRSDVIDVVMLEFLFGRFI